MILHVDVGLCADEARRTSGMRLLLHGQQLVWTFKQRLKPPLNAGRASLGVQDRRPVHESRKAEK